MASAGQSNGDIRATLALSQDEARTGTSRTLTLSGGRRVTVPIPPGVYNGQEIRLSGQGEPTWAGGPAGDLILTLAVSQATRYAGPFPTGGNDSPTEFVEAPPPPPFGGSSPNYAPIGSGTTFAGYPQQGQDQLYLPHAQTEYVPPVQYGQPPYYGQQQPLPQPTPQYPQPRRRRGLALGVTLLLLLLALLLIGGGGLLFYANYYLPNQQHAQATATVQTQLTGTAQANVTATAQTSATAQAQANATATAQTMATAQASATATALQAIYTQSTSGTPALSDPLTGQDSNNWQEITSTVNGSCGFSGGAYHSSIPQKGYFQPCFAEATNFDNFALQVQMTVVKGDRGGIIFRADDANSKFYLFRISTSGAYDLFEYVDDSGKDAKNLLNGSTSLFNAGQANTVTIVANGGNMYFYINQQYLASVSDSTYASGKIGVFAESSTNPTDVAFNNLKIWKL